MAKKKVKPVSEAREKPFRTAQFATLKGIVVAEEAASATLPPNPKTVPEPAEDEALLFQQAMLGTRPIVVKDTHLKQLSTPNDKNLQNSTITSPSVDSDISTDFMNEISRLKLEVTFSENRTDEDELKPLSGNRLRQLKRGVVSVGAELDLHGLTKDETLLELPRFLRSAQARNETAVLIITGKGNNSAAEPVLQRAVAGWLRDAGRSVVSEFSPAPREMGGNGAFVVFLKKLKTPR